MKENVAQGMVALIVVTVPCGFIALSGLALIGLGRASGVGRSMVWRGFGVALLLGTSAAFVWNVFGPTVGVPVALVALVLIGVIVGLCCSARPEIARSTSTRPNLRRG